MTHGEALELIHGYINAENVAPIIGDLKGSLFRFLGWLDKNGYQISKPVDSSASPQEPKCAKPGCGESYGAPSHNPNNWMYHEFVNGSASPQVSGKYPIDRPCSACSAGDLAMEHHDHEPPFRKGYGPKRHVIDHTTAIDVKGEIEFLKEIDAKSEAPYQPGLRCNHCGTTYAGLNGPCPKCGKNTAQKVVRPKGGQPEPAQG